MLTGSCVTVTEVKPPKVSEEDPSDIAVVPIVTDELVNDEFPMFVRVFVDPLIDLFVRVCRPVSVATVESIAIVIGADPSYEPPDRPVPIVSGFAAEAVTVTEPPNATGEPLMVMESY